MIKEINLHEVIGGKAYNLKYLKIKNTPFFITIDTDKLFASIKEVILNLFTEEKYLKIQELIFNFDLINSDIHNELNAIKKFPLLAVRSSAANEDLDSMSFAGIYDSFLNVSSNELISKIKLCYASAFSKRAMDYYRLNKVPIENIKMTVIIQEMIVADLAGVINTINPITNNPDEIVVSVVKGLGDALVSGERNSSDYYLAPSGKINKISGEKILTKKEIKRLVNLVTEVKEKTNTFQDIEFAIKKGKVYFLQSRTITPYQNIKLDKPRITLDNSNIIESYSGIVTPLTFSFALEVYQKVYTTALNVGRINQKIVKSLEPSLAKMLCLYQNRVYYNLNSWYHLNSIFPFKKKDAYMEKMMGVSNALNHSMKVKMSWFSLIKFGIIFFGKLRKIEKLSDEFVKKFDEVVMKHVGQNFNHLSSNELVEFYLQLEKNILNDFSTPIINDCGSMLYFGLLNRKVNKLKINNPEGYIASLLAEQGEIIYSAPLFNKITNKIISNQSVKEDFKNLTSEELIEKYHLNSFISQEIANYLTVFGPRVIDELKLETITLIEEPVKLYQMLKMALSQETKNIEVAKSLPIKVKISWWQRKRFNRLVEKTRYFVKNRENLRLKRTYIYSVVRNIFLSLGHNFFKENLLHDPRDIFFLKKFEIFDLVAGKSLPIKKLVIERQKEYFSNSNIDFYNRLALYGDEVLPILTSNISNENNVLKGVPSGGGKVKGKIKIIENINETLVNKDDIILTLRTDPGWVTVFPLIKGLIVEKGSILSHSAIVAREMGLPAIFAVAGATKILKNGDEVTLDAVKGEITIHEKVF